LIVAAVILVIPSNPVAQDRIDTVYLSEDEFVYGEIKGMDEGVLLIKTRYSDKDFHIEWSKIRALNTVGRFVILTENSDRLYGPILYMAPDRHYIDDEAKGLRFIQLSDIVYIKQVDSDFWSRFELTIAAGYTATKANDSHQFSGDLGIKYISTRYACDLTLSAIRTIQTENDLEARIIRTEGGLGLLYFIHDDFFAIGRTDLLESSEQKLSIRAITKGGMGYYFYKTNRMNAGAVGGIAWNYEDYASGNTSDRNSAELFIGLEYKIFDLNDLELTTKAIGYPSLTEGGRFRTDFQFDISYEFESDFFIGLGFTNNFDNMPAEGAPKNDYVFRVKIGWTLD
jgi:hypothetical protein